MNHLYGTLTFSQPFPSSEHATPRQSKGENGFILSVDRLGDNTCC